MSLEAGLSLPHKLDLPLIMFLTELSLPAHICWMSARALSMNCIVSRSSFFWNSW